ncbi:MAG: hypothetical protein HY960_12760 [Ignavibacteriae bacterium]|nr:hypothetical protein [Ignavibacteriota bacterium]
MAFIGEENHAINLDDAERLTANFRDSGVKPDIKGGFFGRKAIEEILAQQDCVGIRVYFAQQDDGSPTFVLVGADANENDMENGLLAEEGRPCPPYCGTPSRLNS